jgi:hypothetical protein
MKSATTAPGIRRGADDFCPISGQKFFLARLDQAAIKQEGGEIPPLRGCYSFDGTLG